MSTTREDEAEPKAQDFLETMFRNYILQHWSQERIIRFALHLLGDKAQTLWHQMQDSTCPQDEPIHPAA